MVYAMIIVLHAKNIKGFPSRSSSCLIEEPIVRITMGLTWMVKGDKSWPIFNQTT